MRGQVLTEAWCEARFTMGDLHFLYEKVTEETVRFPLCSSKIQSSYRQVLLPAKLEIVAAELACLTL